MGSWKPQSALGFAVFGAGFKYDSAQDIIYSRMYAPQRLGGYTWAYDVAAPGGSMILDCEPIYFVSGKKKWMIELWKGQYGLETGCEIGLYNHTDLLAPPGSERRLLYRCANDHEIQLLTLAFSLKRDGKELFRRGPESHWWLTGFRWGVFTDPTSSLVMDIEIAFLPASGDMRHEFLQALKKLGYHPTTSGHKVHFTFHRPKTLQPATRYALEPRMQSHNKTLVDGYAALKKELGLRSNDPNAFTIARERRAVRAVPKKHLVQPRARKVVNKVVARGRRLLDKELGKLRGDRDVFAFFHDKVWHNTHHPARTS